MNDESNTNTDKSSNTLQVIITDEELTRLLDVQEADKEKWDAVCYHIFQLGLSARENSIKATKERNTQKEHAAARHKIASYMRINPALAAVVGQLIAADVILASDSVKLLSALVLEVAKRSMKAKEHAAA